MQQLCVSFLLSASLMHIAHHMGAARPDVIQPHMCVCGMACVVHNLCCTAGIQAVDYREEHTLTLSSHANGFVINIDNGLDPHC